MLDIQSEEELTLEDNQKVLQMLEDGIIIRRLQENEGWKLIDRVCKKLGRDAETKLKFIPATVDNLPAIRELQVIAKLYGDVLGSLKDSFISIGNMAFEEAKLRELIQAPENDG